MARIRTIKPEFPQSESMGRVSRDARLLFVMLWTICDDDGRARANSRMLASLLFPYDDDAKDGMGSWLGELERENCVTVYEVDGNTYLQIQKWQSHQRIDKPTASKFPPPQEGSRKVANAREPSTLEGNGREGSGKDLEGTIARSAVADAPNSKNSYPDDFEQFWSGYPTDKNMSKKLAFKRWKALSPGQRTSALTALPAFRAYCEQNKSWYRPKHAEGWLVGERFDGFLDDAVNDPGMSPERLAELQDRTDRIMGRGKYAVRDAAE